MKTYLLEMPKEVHKAIKQLATEKESTIKSILLDSVKSMYGEEFTKYLNN
jgi:hypothetical protein